MKKVMFKMKCYDKNTGERYKFGQIKEFTNKRAAEIVKTGRAEYYDTDNTEAK